MARSGIVAAFLFLTVGSGCIVGQKPGLGTTLHRDEATTGTTYWLYVPKGAEMTASAQSASGQNPRPLVLTLHGMKPFDSAGGQIYEWQQEADRYGFVVCAPELSTPSLGSPLPLEDARCTSLRRDETNILAVLDEVQRTAKTDPNAVLVSSWSYGGYLAHYMANRHPERFRAVAVRQSNFSARLLDANQVPKYRDKPVGIFYTENDFARCRVESQDAARWYAQHGFDVTFGVFAGRGHERAPSLAAAFFAKTLGIEPQSPPVELATFQVKEIPFSPSSKVELESSGPTRPIQAASGSVAGISAMEPPSTTNSSRPGAAARTVHATSLAEPLAVAVPSSPPIVPETKDESIGGSRQAQALFDPVNQTVTVNVDSPIGLAPMWLNYGVTLPQTSQLNGLVFSWYLNGKLISSGLNGQALITDAGDHLLHVIVKTADGTQFHGSRTVTVLPRKQQAGS